MFLSHAPPYNYCCHGIMCPKDFFDTRLGYKARSVLSETELWGGDVLGSQVSQPSRPWNGRHWYSNSHPLCSRPTRCKTTHQVKAATLHTVNNNLSSQIRKWQTFWISVFTPPWVSSRRNKTPRSRISPLLSRHLSPSLHDSFPPWSSPSICPGESGGVAD